MVMYRLQIVTAAKCIGSMKNRNRNRINLTKVFAILLAKNISFIAFFKNNDNFVGSNMSSKMLYFDEPVYVVRARARAYVYASIQLHFIFGSNTIFMKARNVLVYVFFIRLCPQLNLVRAERLLNYI